MPETLGKMSRKLKEYFGIASSWSYSHGMPSDGWSPVKAECKLLSINWEKHGNAFFIKRSADAPRNHWFNIAFSTPKMMDLYSPFFSVVQRVLIKVIS